MASKSGSEDPRVVLKESLPYGLASTPRSGFALLVKEVWFTEKAAEVFDHLTSVRERQDVVGFGVVLNESPELFRWYTICIA